MKNNNTYMLSRALQHVVLDCIPNTTRTPYSALYVTRMSGPNYFLTSSTFLFAESLTKNQLDSVTGVSINCKNSVGKSVWPYRIMVHNGTVNSNRIFKYIMKILKQSK